MARLYSKVYGIQCSFCVDTLVKALERMDGVSKAYVSSTYEEIYVEYDERSVTIEEIRDKVESLGYRLDVSELEREYVDIKRRLLLSLGISVFIGVYMLLMGVGISIPMDMYLVGLASSANLLILGGKYISMSLTSLRNRILNQHVLMVLTGVSGIVGGLIGLLYSPEEFPVIDFFGVASFVTTYHLFGGFIGEYVHRRSRDAIEKFKRLMPRRAKVLRNGVLVEVDVDSISRGDIVLIEPGMRSPVDGRVVEGESYFDESHVTGEPGPVYKARDMEVVSGSLNMGEPVKVLAVRVGADTFLSRVIEYVKLARASKPSIIRILDRVLRFYVPAVIVIGLVASLAWLILPYVLLASVDITTPLYVLLTVYVMGYPCALGMATPLTMIMGGSLMARNGVLIRNGDSIERVGRIKTIVFDKTGTITVGRPWVAEVIPYGDVDVRKVIGMVACVELHVKHPVSDAIVEYATSRYGVLECPEPIEIKYFKGEGVSAILSDGNHILVGGSKILSRYGISPPYVQVDQGGTAVYVAVDGDVVLTFILRDVVRHDAYEAVALLRERGFEIVVMSGDSPSTVGYVARQLGIDNYMGGLYPWEKQRVIRDMQREGGVMMVGDGINDAPSLTQADVGVAFSTGIDISIDSADIIVFGSSLKSIPFLIDMSRKIYRKVKANLALAFLFNALGIPLASLGLIRPMFAMIAMVLSVSAVTLNSVIFRFSG